MELGCDMSRGADEVLGTVRIVEVGMDQAPAARANGALLLGRRPATGEPVEVDDEMTFGVEEHRFVLV